MGPNDQEIEIKVEVDAESFGKIKERVKEIAEFIGESNQNDEYFVPKAKSFLKANHPYEWLRLRKSDKGNGINYKHFYPREAKIKTHCDEFETDVENISQLEKILFALNFEKLVEVIKKRETYHIKDFEIAFDKVEDLGFFIEIEAKRDFGDVMKTKEKIIEFSKEIGLENFKEAETGYPFLLMRKKGLID